MPVRGFMDYYQLPDDLKAEYTLEQWAWLSDAEKARAQTEQGWPDTEGEDPPS